MYTVLRMEDGTEYKYQAKSGYQAMEKMRYTLDLVHRDPACTIDLVNGRTWVMEHGGKTYACRIFAD